MEYSEGKLCEVGVVVREALEAETARGGDIRIAREHFLQQVAERNVDTKDAPRARTGTWRWMVIQRFWTLVVLGATAVGALTFGLRGQRSRSKSGRPARPTPSKCLTESVTPATPRAIPLPKEALDEFDVTLVLPW